MDAQSCNPDLIAVRQNLQVSSDAWAVARQFPMSLNPTVAMDVRPWVFERVPGQGVEQLATVVNFTWMQPIEFGHQTQRRAGSPRLPTRKRGGTSCRPN